MPTGERCENMSFGVNSLLLTTLQVAFGALFIAVPLGGLCDLSQRVRFASFGGRGQTNARAAGRCSFCRIRLRLHLHRSVVVEVGDYAFAQGGLTPRQTS